MLPHRLKVGWTPMTSSQPSSTAFVSGESDLPPEDIVDVKEEITPSHLRCIPGSCPGVYALSDGNLLIIGKKPSDSLYKQVEAKIADDEFAVVLSPEFFQNVEPVSK
jgi:hypothetical protein